MSDPPDRFDVAIVGGGISGLATAWYLRAARPELSIVVLEAGERAGGKIGSVNLLGVEIDTGPDAFLARVNGGVDLAQELGLSDSLVAPGTGQAWVWSRGQLRALPTGLVLGVPSDPEALAQSGILSPGGLAAANADETTDVHIPAFGGDPSTADISVAEGIGAHLGREVVELLVDPLLGGISAADCDRLSLRSASAELFVAAQAPRLMAHLRYHNAAVARGQIGVTEQRPVFLTPRSGLHTLTTRLAERLGDVVRTRTSVESLARAEGEWMLDTVRGPIHAASCVLALPAGPASHVIGDVAPELTLELAGTRTSSVALVLLAYSIDAVNLPPGSGFLVPRPEGRLITAASWWSQKWPHLNVPGHVIIRASAGRDGDTRFVDLSDDDLVAALHADLVEMVGVRARPTATNVARWMNGFPLYDVGHSARVQRCEALADAAGIELVGASYRGVGLPACIRDAQRAASRILDRLSTKGRWEHQQPPR